MILKNGATESTKILTLFIGQTASNAVFFVEPITMAIT